MTTVAPLEFKNLSFAYNSKPILSNINLAIQTGEIKAITGPNGSGKSTLINLATGYLKKFRGEVLLFGQPVSRFKNWQDVGYVPQNTLVNSEQLYPGNVLEVIAQGLYRGIGIRHFWEHWIRKNRDQLELVMEQMRVTHLGDQLFRELSLGQQQRVLLARAMIKQPKLLLLDEPISAIDAEGRREFNDMLRRINVENNVTIVIVTHDLSFIEKNKLSCACLNCKLVYNGPAEGITDANLTDLFHTTTAVSNN